MTTDVSTSKSPRKNRDFSFDSDLKFLRTSPDIFAIHRVPRTSPRQELQMPMPRQPVNEQSQEEPAATPLVFQNRSAIMAMKSVSDMRLPCHLLSKRRCWERNSGRMARHSHDRNFSRSHAASAIKRGSSSCSRPAKSMLVCNAVSTRIWSLSMSQTRTCFCTR